MAPDVTARDLMRPSFLRLGAQHTLAEAMQILLAPQSTAEGYRTLVIIGPDGSFAGLLTTRYLLRALLSDWIEAGGAAVCEGSGERELLSAAGRRLHVAVGDAMVRDVPAAAPDDRLPRLMDLMDDKRLDCLPVIEGDHVAGVIYLTDVFNAAAKIALASQSGS